MPVPLLTIAEMRRWEQATWSAGVTEADVIAQVGRALAGQILELTHPGDLVLVLAGRGNNGADARAAFPHLASRRVEILEVDDPSLAVGELSAALAREPVLVVDGVFGIGLNRPLGTEWVRLINALNTAAVRVLAVDVPSGLNADTGEHWGTVVRADATLTVGAPKVGLLAPPAWEVVGHLEVARDIGLTGEPTGVDERSWTLTSDFTGLPPRRLSATHKGSFGQAVLLAGSVGYTGAAVLAARAAARARPGLLSLLTPANAYLPVASQLASVMVHPLTPRHPLFNRATAILAGPGLAAGDLPSEVRSEVTRLWREFPGIMVADASALDWLRAGVPGANVRILTPHPGEAARLLGRTVADVQADRPASLRRLAQRYDAIVVLKGHETLVGGARGPIYVNSTGNPGLAQGGTGDVLAGFMTGLLAQPSWQGDPLRTVRYAVWEHGRAADRLEAARRNWTAEDLTVELGAL